MEPATPSRPLPEIISSLARDIEFRLAPGDVAELRRLAPGEGPPPAFWKIVVANPEIEGALARGGEDAERRWAVIMNGLAILRGLHRPGLRAGRALFDAGVKELRFVRLVRARGPILASSVRTVTRALASAGQLLDFTGLAALVLSDGGENEEAARRQLSRDYYAATYRQEKELEEAFE
ncbi:MAG: type I-E CRISPR-associated protein Cse2/CasB [Acidobacteria bacterium]|nr:type I-E CRISPR-associated protein Cse2/CasB [Acidobacteriota bacterium]MCG3194225.1 hypothetical protein [Thermoanaerobaculia bacterium]